MADRSEDAQLALLCQHAYLANGPITNSPALQLPPEWAFRGYLSAEDIFLGDKQRRLFGFLGESIVKPGNFVVAIRGTANIIEWMEDGEFLLEPHPAGGKVESGFHDLYTRLWFGDQPVAEAIRAQVGARIGQGTVTVIGHSLGAAMATYLTLDLANIPGLRVRGRFFASPHPGDAAFAKAFDSCVADYMTYAYELDVVPRSPIGLGYCQLPKITWLNHQNTGTRVRFDLGCNHYLSSYISMLDYTLTAQAAVLAPKCKDCVRGTIGGVTTA